MITYNFIFDLNKFHDVLLRPDSNRDRVKKESQKIKLGKLNTAYKAVLVGRGQQRNDKQLLVVKSAPQTTMRKNMQAKQRVLQNEKPDKYRALS